MFSFKWFYTLLFLMPVLLLVNPAMAQTGEELYNGSSCRTCHDNSVNDAPGPFSGDEGDWEMRLTDKGIEGLYEVARDGNESMSPCTVYRTTLGGKIFKLTNEQCELIVDYMLEEAGVSIPSPPTTKLDLRLFLEGTLEE